jgi:hypothetical protein
LAKRIKFEGDHVIGDLKGMPPVVRRLLQEQMVAIHQLMTSEQFADYLERDTAGRMELVDQVLTEAGR